MVDCYSHRARRKKINDNSPNELADPNNLIRFLLDIGDRTKSMILATATITNPTSQDYHRDNLLLVYRSDLFPVILQ
jgi:hypothetical protein